MLEAKPFPVDPPDPLGKPASPVDSGAGASAAPKLDPTPSEVITDPSAAPYSAHGRLFFRLDGEEYVCSGTVVDSRGRNVVITAGHCVYDPPLGKWVTDMVFVPGYTRSDLDNAPFGTFNATWLATTAHWKGGADTEAHSYDFGAVALDSPLQNQTGARKIEFDAELTDRTVEIFGYPVMPSPEYDGEDLIRCIPASLDFDLRPPPAPYMAWPCDMTKGASGGGWIADRTYLTSVVSYGYDQASLKRRLYGPQLGSEAIAVYRSPNIGGSVSPTVGLVRNPPASMRKRAVNIRAKGSGSTPVQRFKVRLDRKDAVYTGPLIKVRRLSIGTHRLWIRSMDQTGHLSRKTIKRTIRVLPKQKKKPKRRR